MLFAISHNNHIKRKIVITTIQCLLIKNNSHRGMKVLSSPDAFVATFSLLKEVDLWSWKRVQKR